MLPVSMMSCGEMDIRELDANIPIAALNKLGESVIVYYTTYPK